ncbi:hypothetical protein BH23ACT6_BH23ACT6_17120 [soil metagenome]
MSTSTATASPTESPCRVQTRRFATQTRTTLNSGCTAPALPISQASQGGASYVVEVCPQPRVRCPVSQAIPHRGSAAPAVAALRSCRTASAPDSPSSTLTLYRTRSTNSAIVRRSSDVVSSARATSDSDLPCSAASALGWRWTAGGTFRIWIERKDSTHLASTALVECCQDLARSGPSRLAHGIPRASHNLGNVMRADRGKSQAHFIHNLAQAREGGAPRRGRVRRPGEAVGACRGGEVSGP